MSADSTSEFEVVIGLEVHAQLLTDSKIFARSSTVSGKTANTLTDPVTLGLPGSLPVLNKRSVDFAIRLGLALQCSIERTSIFARKHYLYPDLPKGYQISQYDKPICLNGSLVVRIKDGTKKIGITRIHLEEDAGKNTHLSDEPYSLVDLNRAGVPLLEIVSEPDMRSPEEAGAYMRQLRQVLLYLDICDGNMEEGSLRCDANVSIRRRGETKLGTKVEVKNLNSFRFVERALEYEIERQIAAVREGTPIVQETRLWDEAACTTLPMRSKEHAEDYRYFPDPDLLPLVVDDDWIAKTKSSLPELPAQVYERFRKSYELDPYYCEILAEEKAVARYYDEAVAFHNNPIAIANWITTELFGRLNKESMAMSNNPISPENLASLILLVDNKTISGKMAKAIFDEMFSTGSSPRDIIEAQGLKQISDPAELETLVDSILSQSAAQLQAYRDGKTKMFGYFVGQVMKASDGKANPQIVNELLERKLKA